MKTKMQTNAKGQNSAGVHVWLVLLTTFQSAFPHAAETSSGQNWATLISASWNYSSIKDRSQ